MARRLAREPEEKRSVVRFDTWSGAIVGEALSQPSPNNTFDRLGNSVDEVDAAA
jgi:hypothetical protein